MRTTNKNTHIWCVLLSTPELWHINYPYTTHTAKGTMRRDGETQRKLREGSRISAVYVYAIINPPAHMVHRDVIFDVLKCASIETLTNQKETEKISSTKVGEETGTYPPPRQLCPHDYSTTSSGCAWPTLRGGHPQCRRDVSHSAVSQNAAHHRPPTPANT